jgi:hypothetical protein
MQPSRRRLLWISSVAAASWFFTSASGSAQDAGSNGRGRRRPDGSEDPTDSPNSPSLNATKTMLEDRQKNIKKDVEKLYNLASQLKAEVEKTDSTTVLSLAMLKKAEEIEKLAKQIKDHAKG